MRCLLGGRFQVVKLTLVRFVVPGALIVSGSGLSLVGVVWLDLVGLVAGWATGDTVAHADSSSRPLALFVLGLGCLCTYFYSAFLERHRLR